MTNKPTRETVQSAYDDLSPEIGTHYFQSLLDLIFNAYLAQEDELKAINIENKAMIPHVELVDKLESENRELREALVNQRRSLGRESDDLWESLVKIQVAAKEEEIDRLQADNQALKEQLVKEKEVRATFEELSRQKSLRMYGANN